jgi:DNA-binding protein HU-beta
VENGGEPGKTPGRGSQARREETLRVRLISPLLQTQPLALGVKTGNGHVFPIDNPVASARIAIAGARALSFPPRLMRGNRKRLVSGESMNKADLVDRIAGACSISKAQATTAIDTTVDSVTAALRKGDRVALIGFGTFSVSQRKARNGRNPQTGATIKIAARRVAKFTPGNELKKVVNKGK